MPPFSCIAGHAISSLVARIPNRGPWVVEAELGEGVAISGRVEVQIGSLRLSGTVAPAHSGTFVQSTHVRIVAGAGGWASLVRPKAYHNDAQIKAREIADDAAREVGESIGSFKPTAERVGIDYVRANVAASLVLESVIGSAPWWVDFEGKTNVGERPSESAKGYDLVAFDPATRMATLTADDPAAISIGSILDDARLERPETVRQVDITVHGEDLRILAWCAGDGSTDARLVRVLGEIAKHATGGKLFGIFRYRVAQMAGDRVELQAISKAAGLPDILPIDMHPGLAGAHSELAKGAEVLVEFVEGSPTMPVITGFGPKGSPGATPVSTTIDAGTIELGAGTIRFGANASKGAARKGDSVAVLLPPANIAGFIPPLALAPTGLPNPTAAAFTGLLTWTGQTVAIITDGSSKTLIE